MKIITRVMTQSIIEEKIFPSYSFGRELISRIYKELKKLITNNAVNI
jgi:hypothetical protein